ncbi:MAG TPA: GNAT family N-acetyltransferase [Solirubrobacteraceae bacterium]|nr:GNAT family N-acetyltransferase [Solirubrobacteraceae bacterium]
MDGLRLEPLAKRHLDGVETLVTDPDVLRFTRMPEPPPAGFARDWVARYETGQREGTLMGFAAVDERGAFLGLALAPHIDPGTRELELGYIVAPAARGRGVATAMLRDLTRWAFAELGALRAYLLIDTGNVASQRVAERCGYVLEGVLRSVHLKQDRRSDQMIWSRLPTDPEPG